MGHGQVSRQTVGLGVDSKGNIYTFLLETGEVVRVKDDGSYEHIACLKGENIAIKKSAYFSVLRLATAERGVEQFLGP